MHCAPIFAIAILIHPTEKNRDCIPMIRNHKRVINLGVNGPLIWTNIWRFAHAAEAFVPDHAEKNGVLETSESSLPKKTCYISYV